MIGAMPSALAFCRLVLGADGAAQVADGAPLAEAWTACEAALARRRGQLAWEQPPAPGLAARLAGLGDRERGAVAARALGASPEETARALRLAPDEVPALLARAHAGLAEPGQAPGDGAAQLPALRALAGVEAPDGRRATGARGAGAIRLARSEPTGRAARLAVALAVLLLAAGAGYAAVSAVQGEAPARDPEVVTATPVGPLPPGVK